MLELESHAGHCVGIAVKRLCAAACFGVRQLGYSKWCTSLAWPMTESCALHLVWMSSQPIRVQAGLDMGKISTDIPKILDVCHGKKFSVSQELTRLFTLNSLWFSMSGHDSIEQYCVHLPEASLMWWWHEPGPDDDIPQTLLCVYIDNYVDICTCGHSVESSSVYW